MDSASRAVACGGRRAGGARSGGGGRRRIGRGVGAEAGSWHASRRWCAARRRRSIAVVGRRWGRGQGGVTTVCRVDRAGARRRVRLGGALRAMDLVMAASLQEQAITGVHVEVLRTGAGPVEGHGARVSGATRRCWCGGRRRWRSISSSSTSTSSQPTRPMRMPRSVMRPISVTGGGCICRSRSMTTGSSTPSSTPSVGTSCRRRCRRSPRNCSPRTGARRPRSSAHDPPANSWPS